MDLVDRRGRLRDRPRAQLGEQLPCHDRSDSTRESSIGAQGVDVQRCVVAVAVACSGSCRDDSQLFQVAYLLDRISRLARDIGGPRGYERGDDRPTREYFAVLCSSCGNQAQVPFKPRMDRPVYCSDCFRTVKPD